MKLGTELPVRRSKFAPVAVIFLVVFFAWLFTGNAKADTLYGSGSGSFVTSNGYVLTVAHVACIPNTKLTILYNGVESPATVTICDTTNDIALIKADVTTPYTLPVNGDTVLTGSPLYVDGFPLPEMYNDHPIFAAGIATGNLDEHFRSMNLAIAPGHSGSPVVDSYGNVVGTVNAVAIAENSIMQGMDISSKITNLLTDIKAQGLQIPLLKPNLLNSLEAIWNMPSYLEKRVVEIKIYVPSGTKMAVN